MKKIISVLSAIAIIFMITGCQEKRSNIVPVIRGISFVGEITYYNECYESKITIAKNGDMKIEMTSPDTIKGMSFNFTGDDVTFSYNDLQYKYTLDSMPEGIVCTSINSIFKDCSKKDAVVISDKDTFYILGNTGDCDYKMYVGATGLPIEINESNSGLKINIENATLLK